MIEGWRLPQIHMRSALQRVIWFASQRPAAVQQPPITPHGVAPPAIITGSVVWKRSAVQVVGIATTKYARGIMR